MFVHDVLGFLKVVWDIVAFEAILAFLSLEGDSAGKTQADGGVDSVSNDKKSDKKSEKKKKLWGISALLNPRHAECDTLLRKIKETVESNDSRRLPKPPKVKQELEDLRDKLQPLTMKYRKEKQRIDEIRRLTQKREKLLFDSQEAERMSDLARVADMKYGSLPEIDVTIAKVEGVSEENMMLTETVGPDQIAEVVSRSGIPVTRLGQNDKERLVGLGDRLHKRVVGQDLAVEAVAEAVLRSRARLGRQQQPTGSFLFLGPNGVGKTEQWFDT